MIYGACGNVGSGKTLFLASLLFNEKEDTTLWTNIKLKDLDYELIETAEDLDRIPHTTEDKLVVIDELHQFGADSWNYSSLAKKLMRFGTQHRKKHVTLWYSTQIYGQVSNRLRMLSKYIYFPSIVKWYQGKPVLAELSVTKPIDSYRMTKIGKIYKPLIRYDGHLICDLYDTDQWITDAVDPQDLERDRLVEKYKKVDLTNPDQEKALKSYLVTIMKMPSGKAGHLINHIKYNVQGHSIPFNKL